MGSYPRHQSYHDCPPRLCLSQQAQPPNPSNILEVSPSRLWREKKQQQILTECAIHLSPPDSVRRRQPSVCEQLQHRGLVGGLGRRTPACHPRALLLTSSRATLLTLQFQGFFPLLLLFFSPKIMLVICVLDKFHTPRPHELCATHTHFLSFKMHQHQAPTKNVATEEKFVKRKVRCFTLKNRIKGPIHWFYTCMFCNAFCGCERKMLWVA